ncbi:Cytochrome p450 family protein [Lasiodiplodia theobromae]|uniref:Cytochrome p450 family protein n=1 Tax=Lasiodiplodia theobromae TaxID=45133 RepID=UPI0015C3FDF3|nr:Cytochrome p450 family protein [Lasiodiplodia theobromae]KAF4546694.1 Cytochrome p450 family protein [Lasiodiplodia theobromae]
MAPSIFLSPVFLFASITTVLYFAYRTIALSLARRRFIRENGCLPAASLKMRDPILGIDALLSTIRAGKKHQLLDMLTARFTETNSKTFTSKRLGAHAIMTMEPENVKAILATRFKDFAIAPFRQPALQGFLGDGIFTTDGGHWAASRAMIRPNFVRDQVADLQAFESHFEDLMAAIPKATTTDASFFDLQELFFKFTIDSATEFLFGKSVRSLRPGNSDDAGVNKAEASFAEAFTVAQSEGLDLIRLGPLAHLIGANRARISTGERAVDVVHAYVDQFVDEAVRFREEVAEKDQKRGDVETGQDEEKYVFLHELATRTTDKKRLRSELLNVLLAGRDTTASLLGNLFFVLARQPEVWQKLREEVVTTLQGRRPTYEELRNMKYLKWCLNESLRLHPVVPLNTRMCVRDTVFPTGGGPHGTAPVFVPAGTITSWSVWAMHRRRDIFGADAEDFRPERWERLRVGWEYLPFNGGPRICVGQQYALTEASYVVVRLAQEFEHLVPRDGEEQWREQVALTLCPGNGCWVRLVPPSSSSSSS